jgi:hypothetical protein
VAPGPPGRPAGCHDLGPGVLEPGRSIFWDAVRSERPELARDFHPWDRINEPPSLDAMLREGGVSADHIAAEPGAQPLESAEDFWSIALGSGFRATIEALDEPARRRVRSEVLRALDARKVRPVQANALYAFARKREARH